MFYIWLLISLSALFNETIYDDTLYKKVQQKLILAKEGEVIELPEGKYFFNRSLWGDNLKNVTINGAGIDKTIISFEKQIEGAEGIKIVNSEKIALQNFTIENSRGDLIKVEDSVGVIFNNVRAQWTYGPKETNGAYAFYPVKCKNILIDRCVAIGASDAGIYVGQSSNIIVRNSEAFNNVAGIEIENSTFAKVYNNYTHDNTGGILIFDLPDLLVKKGGYVSVYNNNVSNNNLSNFAPEGNIVAKVPTGTGIMIMATSDVQVYNNQISNNKTANTSIVSYYITEELITDSLYYPYPNSIYIYNNSYQREKQFPSFSIKQPIGFLLSYYFWRDIPDIIYDGIIDSSLVKNNQIIDDYRICIQNNENADFVNLDFANNFKNLSQDLSFYNCEHKKFE